MDSIYLQKVLNGDTDAFRYFVTNYKDFAFSLSFSILKNEYMAEEAIQESFIKAFEKLSSYRKDSSFKTWFARIVINESLRRSSRKIDMLSVEKTSEYELELAGDALESMKEEDQKFYISTVFEELPAEMSLVLELFYLKEFSIKEIKEMTSWKDSKIKMLLLRGRERFYMALNRTLKHEAKDIL